MARISLRQLLDHAAEHSCGVPAFYINNMEQGLAIMEAAKLADAPVIIQASRGARSWCEFDPRKFLKPAMDALCKLCKERFVQFGTAGHASEIRIVPLAEMAKRYKAEASIQSST